MVSTPGYTNGATLCPGVDTAFVSALTIGMLIRNLISTAAALVVIAAAQFAPGTVDVFDSESVPQSASCVSAYRGQPDEDPTVVACGSTLTVRSNSSDPWLTSVVDCLAARGYAGYDTAVTAPTATVLECEKAADR
jgi:hypothetical protein